MRSRRTGYGLLAVAIVIILIVVMLALRDDRYGEMSGLGYDYATALYSACNQRDVEKLETLMDLIDQSRAEQQIDPRENRWLIAIIDRGREGDWETAAQESRALMLNQVQTVK